MCMLAACTQCVHAFMCVLCCVVLGRVYFFFMAVCVWLVGGGGRMGEAGGCGCMCV